MSHLNLNNMVDLYQREVRYLRLSVTDRCNLRCRYCAPAMPNPKPSHQLLTLDEMYRLVRIGSALGITKVRLTGGEPLCRKGLVGLVAKLVQLPRIEDISLTTNGTLLLEHVRQLKAAGMRRINISLDTLHKHKFAQLAGVDGFDKVWQGIMAAMEMGFEPIKINTVVMRDFNDSELEDLAQLTMRYPIHVRFIEYMPIGIDPSGAGDLFVSVAQIETRLHRLGKLRPVAARPADGPARCFRFDGAPGQIGLIGSMSAHFCGSCNRLRLTAGGCLRPCLLSDDQMDILTPMRQGASDKILESLFIRSIGQKKARHKISFKGSNRLHTKMVSIGG